MVMSAVLERVAEFQSALSEAEPRRVEVLRKLIKALRGFVADPQDDRVFSALLTQSQSVLELEDDELGDILKVSRTTVGRWARGVTAPHAVMQDSVFSSIAKIAESRLKQHTK